MTQVMLAALLLCFCLALEQGCPVCRRNEIALCGRLLGVSAHALHSNPGLILLVVVTKVVMTLAILPIFAFVFLSYTNGHIARNGERSLLHGLGYRRSAGTGGKPVGLAVLHLLRTHWVPHNGAIMSHGEVLPSQSILLMHATHPDEQLQRYVGVGPTAVSILPEEAQGDNHAVQRDPP